MFYSTTTKAFTYSISTLLDFGAICKVDGGYIASDLMFPKGLK